jgi:hypothetical protein
VSTKRVLFLENPHDLETLLESIKIAANQNKEIIFMDRLIATIRMDSNADLTNTIYRILHDLKLMKLETTE